MDRYLENIEHKAAVLCDALPYIRDFVLRRKNKVRVGLDIGSTTIKCVVLGESFL